MRIWWDVAGENFADPDELVAFIVETLNLVNPQGTRGLTFWMGPDDAERKDMPLRLDLDPEPGAGPFTSFEEIAELPEITLATVSGAAAVSWLPDDLVAVEANFEGRDIAVMEDSGQGLVTVPAARARVSVPSAISAAVDYLRTGDRPANVSWQAAPSLTD
jgi:hypothetical protein